MTLAPSRGLGHGRFNVPDRQDWTVPEHEAQCAVPNCTRPPEPGAHHIEPRSRTGGPKAWVTIDGNPVYNLCRLCSDHHRAVTGDLGGHRAMIMWHKGTWYWETLHGGSRIGDYLAGPLRGSYSPKEA